MCCLWDVWTWFCLKSVSYFYPLIFTFVVQWLSRVQLFATSWTAAHQAFLSFSTSLSLLQLMSTESMMPSNHLILRHPLLFLPSIFPSIRVFSNELAVCIRWPNYCIGTSASALVLPMNIQSWFPLGLTGLIFLLSKGLLSLLQHPRSKVWILWHSAFFTVQLSHPYTTTGKTIALTRWTFVSEVMSLLFNILSRLVIVFFPRSKHF